MGVQVQVGVPTPVLTEGPLQCGADGAGAQRGRGKCAEQARLALGLDQFIDG